ncbi:MFS transporter [Dinghuibacter silviterrae]|uniref:Maltose/moltooligosaccharide transporter n=1 Tax=Dinghuibacter silviterrae TaxID=1539049 RepID=A0A4R8DRZ8_9BACT|nr:MFS transporter [Dinghuibacter silviterrae]TDX01000.1 maltose/moltooligosaccharide transporter [Dinghuibacter silviterrae]
MAVISLHRPKLTFWQIWNMSFGFLGIQFGFALQNANVSRIFQTLGAQIDDISILWLAAPCTGLLVQPIIGYLSDRTWHPWWGRRRPFFFAGAILASLALILMPQSSTLLMAALILWVLDASINISMEPFRAFVGDKLPGSQRTAGFAMQTFFIGLGAVVASLLPYIFTNVFKIPNTAPERVIPLSVRYSFYVGGLVYIVAVMWTVFSTKEFPPENIDTWEEEKLRTKGLWKGIAEIARGFGTMPITMRQLALVQFFTWIAFFSMWIYTSPAVAQNAYGTTDPTTHAFQTAGDWVGVMFMVYNGVSALMAFVLPVVAGRLGRRFTHMICLLIGGASLVSVLLIHTPWVLLVPMVGIGLAWASTLTMPYAILAGALPSHKMGFYMGVFNFFVVIPQILAAWLLGHIVKWIFHNQSIYALVVGGFSMMIGGVLNLIVQDKDELK